MISGSLAKRIAAMMEAEITKVERNRSDFWRSSFSRAMARFISPMASSIGEQKANSN